MENDEKKMPESEAIAALQKQLKEKDEIIKDKDKTIMQLINDAGKNDSKKDDSKDDDSKDDESKEKTPEDEEKENREKRFKYYEKMLKR